MVLTLLSCIITFCTVYCILFVFLFFFWKNIKVNYAFLGQIRGLTTERLLNFHFRNYFCIFVFLVNYQARKNKLFLGHRSIISYMLEFFYSCRPSRGPTHCCLWQRPKGDAWCFMHFRRFDTFKTVNHYPIGKFLWFLQISKRWFAVLLEIILYQVSFLLKLIIEIFMT